MAALEKFVCPNGHYGVYLSRDIGYCQHCYDNFVLKDSYCIRKGVHYNMTLLNKPYNWDAMGDFLDKEKKIIVFCDNCGYKSELPILCE